MISILYEHLFIDDFYANRDTYRWIWQTDVKPKPIFERLTKQNWQQQCTVHIQPFSLTNLHYLNTFITVLLSNRVVRTEPTKLVILTRNWSQIVNKSTYLRVYGDTILEILFPCVKLEREACTLPTIHVPLNTHYEYDFVKL